MAVGAADVPQPPRDRNFLSYSASLDPTSGLVRARHPADRSPPVPYIEPFWTQGTEDNATALDGDPKQTHVFFPDRDGAVAQGWDSGLAGDDRQPALLGRPSAETC